MAFEIHDFDQIFIDRGDFKGLFNVARDDTTSAVERYYAYQSDTGAYIIQKSTTEGTTAIRAYKYYGVGRKKSANFAADWADRANKTYLEYYQLFNQ